MNGENKPEPYHCPKCKTQYWNEPREKDMGWFYWCRLKRAGKPLPAHYADNKEFIEDCEKLWDDSNDKRPEGRAPNHS
ncbi:MAG: hypothetical protein ACRD5E_04230 [Nitrososphaeraceae archaeon]